MNGAESLVRAVRTAGVEVCFSNPGTSEMPLVAAFDSEPGLRGVLVLFEGVASGAADGYGRMAEPSEILAAITRILTPDGRLAGRRALVTSGPTREPIDPVRYLSNHSSGKQGHAIAAALAALGAETVLVSGPTQEPTPSGVTLVGVETARQMLKASEAALPSGRPTGFAIR